MWKPQKFHLLNSWTSQSAIRQLTIASSGRSTDCLVRRADQFFQKRNLPAALEFYRQALAGHPASIEAWSGLGAVSLLYGDFEHAAHCYHKVLALDPKDVAASCNLGNALFFNGKFEKGIECFQRAVALDADNADAHLGLAFAYLASGNFEQGWRQYEWRLKKKPFLASGCDAPRWQGEALNGRRILLCAEQGLGDTLQFVRYAPLVAERGGHVVLQVQPQLHRLLGAMEGITEIVSQSQSSLDIHCQCPFLSLPLLFETRLETVPSHVPYIKPHWDDINTWSERMKGSGLKVGLVWAGHPGHVRDLQRSIPLRTFEPLLRVPGISFFSLQWGEAAAQIKDLSAEFAVQDIEGHCTDFGDTAAALTALDLVISVDTSVAHLAGALRKPVWILLPYVPDWRWLLKGDTCPWYPTARLFRQPAPGDWPAVIADVATQLKILAAGPAVSA